MAAYEIQLRYVIRDKIQSESVREFLFVRKDFFPIDFFSKENFFLTKKFFFVGGKFFFEKQKCLSEENISLKKNFVGKKFLSEKKFSQFCLGFPMHMFLVVSDKLMLIITKRYTYRNN